MSPRHHNSDSNGSITVRVSNLELFSRDQKESNKELHQRIDNMVEKISNIGKFDMKSILTLGISVVGPSLLVVASLWGLAISPIKSEIDALKTDRNVTSSAFNDRFWRLEAELIKRGELDQRFDRVNDKVSSISSEQDRRRNMIVWRAEFERRERNQETIIEDFKRQISDVRTQFNTLFPPTKTLDEILKRIDRLEGEKIKNGKRE